MSLTDKYYKCPYCGNPDVLVKENEKEVDCDDCKATLRVNHDADYEYGRFIDNTTLSIIKTNEPI